MRLAILTFVAALALTVVPAFGDTLSISLDSNTGSGTISDPGPDANNCVPNNCALFTGVITDNDTQDLYLYLNSITSTPGDSNPASGVLSLDNTFADNVPGVLIGDPDYDFNTYGGPIFGIDIAPDALAGTYTFTIQILGGVNGQDDLNLLGSQVVTVDVLAPEPAALGLLFAGLLPFAVWRGVKRKWNSYEVSR